jgi:hypothetical protein
MPLSRILVHSAWLGNGCTISTLDPSTTSESCVASVPLDAADFVRSYVYIAGNATAEGVEAVQFDQQVDLQVTRTVAVEVLGQFKLPSKLGIAAELSAGLNDAVHCGRPVHLQNRHSGLLGTPAFCRHLMGVACAMHWLCCAGFAPDLKLTVINTGNTMLNKASFTLAIQHEGSELVIESNLECTTTPGNTPFNPSTLSLYSAAASVLDLAPQDGYTCISGAASWLSLKFLAPGNVTLKPVGQISNAVGTVIAPYVFATIPSSPHLTMRIDPSKCQQNMVAGELLKSPTVCGLLHTTP